jgi:hypothetical protein
MIWKYSRRGLGDISRKLWTTDCFYMGEISAETKAMDCDCSIGRLQAKISNSVLGVALG